MKEKDQTFEKYRKYLAEKVEHLSFELLSIYINFYADLSQKEQQFFEQHLSSCSDCQEKFNEVFDTELEIEKKTSLHLVEETKESQLGAVDQLFKFDSNLDPSTQVQQIHSLDRSIAIDIQMKSDQIRLIIQKFPDEYQQRAVKITLPELQVSTRIISFNSKCTIDKIKII